MLYELLSTSGFLLAQEESAINFIPVAQLGRHTTPPPLYFPATSMGVDILKISIVLFVNANFIRSGKNTWQVKREREMNKK